MKRKQKLFIFILLLLTVLAASLLVLSSRGDGLSGLYKIVSAPVKSVQRAFTRLGDDISRKVSVYREYNAIKEKIDQLEEENGELTELRNRIDALEKENAELRRLLELQEETEGYDLLQASVITNDVTDWFNEFTIDLGLKDGVVNGTVVITSYGLVGTVCNAGYNSAKVRCIIDQDSELMCRIQRNDELLRVQGTTNENLDPGLVADRIARTAAIYVGDVIVTADSAGAYPAGLIVGTVAEVTVGEDGVRTARVLPAVNFSSLVTVTVLRPIEPEGPENK